MARTIGISDIGSALGHLDLEVLHVQLLLYLLAQLVKFIFFGGLAVGLSALSLLGLLLSRCGALVVLRLDAFLRLNRVNVAKTFLLLLFVIFVLFLVDLSLGNHRVSLVVFENGPRCQVLGDITTATLESFLHWHAAERVLDVWVSFLGVGCLWVFLVPLAEQFDYVELSAEASPVQRCVLRLVL